MMMNNERKPAALALVLMIMLTVGTFAADGPSYAGQMKQWRAARDAELKADDGWLTLAGLFWLKEGDNRIGSDATGDIILPEGAAPAR